MSAKIHTSELLRVLREKAERIVQQQVDPSAPSDEIDIKRLVHELEVQCVELQLQKEELHRSAQDLEVSRNAFAELYHSAPVAFVTIDASGIIRQVNAAAVQMLAGSDNSLLGSTFYLHVHPEDQSVCFAFLQTLTVHGKATPCKLRLLAANGRMLHVQVHACKKTAQFGKNLGWCLALVDLTELKQAERSLQESEERFRTIADGLPLIVWGHDAEGQQQFVNQTFLEFFGVASKEMRGERWQRVLHPDDAQAYIGAFMDCVRHRRPFHACVRVRRTDGQWRWIESWGRPRQSSAGEFLGYIGASVDITERKQAEEELNTAIEFLDLLNRSKSPQELVNTVIDFISQKTGCDAVGIRLKGEPGYPYCGTRGFPETFFPKQDALCLRVAEGWICYDSSDYRVTGCMCADVINGGFDPTRPCFTKKGSFWTNSATELLAQTAVDGCQAQVCSRCSREGFESVALIQLRSGGTEPVGLLQLNDRRRDYFSLQSIALWERLSDYLSVGLSKLAAEANLRHMNTTLEQMVTERTRLAEARTKQLQSLAVELIETEERERRQFAHLLHDDLQQMLAAAKMQLQAASDNLVNQADLARVEQIIGECIDKSRRLSHELSPPVLRHSGLVASLQWLVNRMGEQFDLAVELEMNVDRWHEYTPLKTFLFRAVQEMLFNVVKHAGVSSARIALSNSDTRLSICVSDQGKGFDHDLLNDSVAGFGLMSIRERARYMGGSLTIDSAPGQGSRFTLVVPLGVENDCVPSKQLSSDKPRRRTSDRPAASASGGTRVLFADDHHVMRQGLINLISGQPGIQVVGEAASGREALDQTRHLRPNVVVMDISMPEMDGVEATRRIKAEWPEVRVIGLSMYEDGHVKKAMRQAGAEILLSKTASMPELLKAIYGIGQEAVERSDETTK